MRQGFKVYDSDTHVNPAADILDRYVEPAFRARLPELAPYRQQFGEAAQGSARLQQYRVGTKFYRRILGSAAPNPEFTGQRASWKGSKPARPRVQDDAPENRVAVASFAVSRFTRAKICLIASPVFWVTRC